MDWSEWTPFIQNNGYRTHYMKCVYLFQTLLFLIPFFFETSFSHIHIYLLVIIGILVFIIHECIHIVAVNKKGDSSFTFSGLFFWLHTNAILSKIRFWVFMSAPFLLLSVMPAILSFYVSSNITSILLFISWINAVISSSDIINSMLIMIKPRKSVFCSVYYRVE
ncbi:DUF3267 domain-containing protein [Bacillus sp. 1P06AnD]|uniref:DUF3267 domain-containing protein n=1 Tax=Bacillus sp. 1P06AnD TaxID=3132208 RepID=UPI0039A2E11E